MEDKMQVENKIISYKMLLEIFTFMQEKLNYYLKIAENEEKKNSILDRKYQEWSFKNIGSGFEFKVRFYDNKRIEFDNFNSFISIFNNRLEDIKDIYVYFRLSYEVQLEGEYGKMRSEGIFMNISENRISVSTSFEKEDNKLDDVYQLIKDKLENAPPKYDIVIKKKKSIVSTVGFAIGFIPSILIAILLMYFETIRIYYSTGYVVFPIITIVLTFFIGSAIGPTKLEGYYKNIMPDKRYVGMDKELNSVYKDDIDDYIQKNEILIGKNVKNLDCRKKIMRDYKKYKQYIPIELAILAVLSLVVLFF